MPQKSKNYETPEERNRRKQQQRELQQFLRDQQREYDAFAEFTEEIRRNGAIKGEKIG